MSQSEGSQPAGRRGPTGAPGPQEPCSDVHLAKSIPARETGGQLRAGAGQESRTTQPRQPCAGHTAEVLGSQGAGVELCFGPVEWRGYLWASPGCSGGEISGSSKPWPLDIAAPCAQTEPVGRVRDVPGEGRQQGPQCLQLGGRSTAPVLGDVHVWPPVPRSSATQGHLLSTSFPQSREREAGGRGGRGRRSCPDAPLLCSFPR